MGIPSDTPTLRPVHARQPTPYPTPVVRDPDMLALPWYGVGGVPEQEEEVLEEPILSSVSEQEPAFALAALCLDVPPNPTDGHTEGEHESSAQKRRARRKWAKDSAHKIRRSLRLKEKEETNFELPEDKAARVQQAKFDYSGASRRLRKALSRSYLLSDKFYPSDDDDYLSDIAVACGASEEEIAGLSGVTASTGQ